MEINYMTDNKNPFALKSYFGTPVLFWIAGLCYAVPAAVYGINFIDFGVSKNTANWGEFGDFLGGVINPTIGLITIWFLAANLNHAEKTHAGQMTLAEKAKDFEVCVALIGFYYKAGEKILDEARQVEKSRVSEAGYKSAVLKNKANRYFLLAEELNTILDGEHKFLIEKYIKK